MLARIALRMATIEALKGKTLVGDNVLDSMITALDADAEGNLTTNQQKPFIMIYTDAGDLDVDSWPRGVAMGGGSVDLVVEIAVAATMTQRNVKGDKEVVPGILATDDALEFFLDMVAQQVVRCLSDPDDEWAEIWRSLTYTVQKVVRARTSSADGTRLAAHQIKMTVDLIDTPTFGEPLDVDAPLSRFLAKLEAMTIPNPDYDSDDEDSPAVIPDPIAVAKAALIRAEVGGDDQAWEVAQRRLGITRSELLALGLGPLMQDEERATPVFVGGSIDVPETNTTATEGEELPVDQDGHGGEP